MQEEVAEAIGGELHYVNYTRQGSPDPDPGHVQPSIHCYAENVAASSNTEKVPLPFLSNDLPPPLI